MGWQDAPLATPAAPAQPAWASAPMLAPAAAPRRADGLWDSVVAGWQSSVPGLVDRGKLPDIVLDPEKNTWYEKLAASTSQMVNEVPEMLSGGILGAIAGTSVAGPGGGTLVGGGAGAMAVPTAIRQSLIEAYGKGEVVSASDFLNRAKIVIKQTAKDAVIGGATAGAGVVAGKIAAPIAADAVAAGRIGEGTARVATGTAVAGAEIGTMAVAPAALEGRLPEPQDFLNAAVMVGGLKMAGAVAGRLREVYARTGIPPEQVVADAKTDSTIAEDLGVPSKVFDEGTVKDSYGEVFYHGTTAKFNEFDPTMGFTPGAWLTKDKSAAAAFGDVKAFTVDVRKPATMADLAQARVEVAKSGLDPMENQQAFNKAVIENLEAKGFDGIRDPKFKGAGGNGADVVAAFRASQIKAVDDVPAGTQLELPGIPRAYQDAAARTNAMDAVPGAKAQEAAAQPFGPVDQAAGEPARPTEVNYNYINTPDDVKGAMARLSEVYEADIQAQRRGTVSWEQTQQEAGKIISDMLGSTEPFQPREPGTPAGAAELLARKQMVIGAAEDMATRARAIAEKGTNATPEETAAFLASIDRAAMIQGEFLGARAEAGRALNILKETKIAAERAEQIQQLIARFGKKPAELADMIAQLDNPAAALKFAKEATKATNWDKFIEAWKAALVSGPITQIANIMGNASFMAMRPAVDAVAAGFGAIARSSERVTMAEPLARIVGNIQGVMDGLKLAKVAFLEDSPGGKAEHKHAIGGTTGYVVRTPFRALGAMDALFRSMAERGEAYTLAARQAAQEGLNPATREYRERIAELAANPDETTAQQVAEAGARFVFQAPLGEKGRAINQFVNAWHLQWAIPFIATPGNVFKEMARLTPAAPIVGEWREAFAKGGVEAQKAVAELALGTGLSALAFSYALSGRISGSGDPDPNKRRVQMASGWQPYSVKIGNTWYSYQRMQPLGTLLGFSADMAEAWEHMTPGESDKIPKILATAFANSVTNQTFLQGMSTLVDALAEPDRKGPKFIQNLAASFVPAIAGQTAQLMDPYAREVQSVKEAVQNRIPGLREELMPKRDPFGEPVKNPDRTALITPVTHVDASQDKVRTEAVRLGVSSAPAPKSIEMPSAHDAKLGKVDLTAQQRDVFGDVAGHMAYQVLHNMVNSPMWEAMPDMVQKRAYQMVFEKANMMGKVAALSDEQRQKEITRITTEVAKRLRSK